MNECISNGIKLTRYSPSSVGIDARGVVNFIDEAEKLGCELHSLMIIRNGKVAVEGWWYPYAESIRHGCYSVTKTFTATAVGFAVSEGLLTLNDKLIEFFPDKAPKQPSENLKSLTIRNLLTLSCGQAAEVDLRDTDDAVAKFLSADFPNKPGSVFSYNSVASHMLAEVILHLTGKSLPEYLKPRLLAPLGITDIRWDKTPQGLEMGGWGIHIKTEDFAKMGLLFLQNGRWQGRQIVPEEWIREASAKQIENSSDTTLPDWGAGYCYQMWRNSTPNSYRMDGAYGQLSFVYPDYNAVITITESKSNVEDIFALVRKHLIPAFKDKVLEQENEDSILCRRLLDLSLNEIPPVIRSVLEDEVTGKVIEFEENSASLIPTSQYSMAFVSMSGIKSAKLIFAKNVCLFSWVEGTQENRVKIGMNGAYADSQTELACALNPIKAAGSFCGDTFSFVMRAIEEPHSLKVKIVFSDGCVSLSYCDPIEICNEFEGHTIHGSIKK